MDFGYVYLCLFMCVLYEFGQSEITCGHLKVVYDYKGNWINCRIRLYPSNELQTVIVESHQYRWILTRNVSPSASPEVILQKNSGTYNKTKYNEDNFTLLIRNLTVLDVGQYQVECWSSNNVFYSSDKVKVKLPEWPTGSPETTQPVSPIQQVESLENTTIIVISVCVVLIVGIISVTVYLIIGKRRGGIQGATRLVSDEGTSALGHARYVNNEDPSSIYNEIDTREMVLDYAKPAHGQPIEIIPVHGPDKKASIATNDDDYDLVNNINDAMIKETDSIEVEYADIIVELPSEKIEAAEKTTDNDYVKVASDLEKETNNELIVIVNESTKPNIVQENKDASIYTNIQDNDIQVPTYAKVSKKKPKTKENNKNEAESLSGKNYSVQFPDIIYSEITKSLNDGCYGQQAAQSLREPATYFNLGPSPQSEKSRLSRTSLRELKYAVLDLPDQDSAPFLKKGQEFKGHAKLQTCLYDDIDFERKAFVAPIRKAPSSWYRRKNKEGKRK